MNYIGVDVHISTLDFAVVNERGRITKEQRIPTGVKGFMDFVKSVRAPRRVFIEEGTLAAWALEICTDFGEDLVITDPKENCWIGKSAQKNDRVDARKLAQLARGKYVKAIHHPVGQRRRFRELVTSYHDTVKSETRIKNKIKAKFRQNGIACPGKTVYSPEYRDTWENKLPRNNIVHLILAGLWDQLANIQNNTGRLLRAIKEQSRRYPEIKKFQQIPGIGPVHAATISAILETPDRFPSKKQVWTYAGLGVVERSSGDKVYARKLGSEYNRLLKYSVKQATQAAIAAKDNPFSRQYQELIVKKGILPHRAKLTVARSILATVYGIWKNGTAYDPNYKKETISGKNRFSGMILPHGKG